MGFLGGVLSIQSPTDGAYWQWNDHEWTPAVFGEHSWSPDQPSVSEPASSQPG
ncbi:IS1341-type transposase [Halanaeroarchaeum sulfurireducens]|uniref:IS1341-type transposase n=1 Tax=Halanaeroarchaeum sulfurireducens TaxID=1604004 RepID=A0A0F7PB09_9EURY|nr:IS1341-type transposase [Halanaeroarchaeum sulfurireducens]ALG80930.1 IS1341-type transposase [Halanaeroarchaeum sulfurireducens]